MLALMTVLFVVVGSIAAAVEYWMWSQGRFTADPEPQDAVASAGRRLPFAAEALAAVGVILVLAGSAVAISQRWLRVSDWGRIAILASVAIGFLIAGFVVRWLTISVTQRLTEFMWCASAACAAGAAAFTAAGVYREAAAGTAVIVGVVLAVYSAALWLLCRREALLALAFVGLISVLCGAIPSVMADTTPWLTIALGLWLLGLAWAVLGWVYPEPFGTSVPAGAAIALIGPALAVHDFGWVYVIGIVTGAAVLAASVPLRNVVLVAFGSCGLFGYITAVVVQYGDRSIGLPGSLIAVGLVFIGQAILAVRLGRASRGQGRGMPPDRTRSGRTAPIQEGASAEGDHRSLAGSRT